MIIKKCRKCNVYTLLEKCKACGMQTVSPHPPRFSFEKEQRYGKYRRAQNFK